MFGNERIKELEKLSARHEIALQRMNGALTELSDDINTGINTINSRMNIHTILSIAAIAVSMISIIVSCKKK